MAPADTADRRGPWRRRAGLAVVVVLAAAAGALAARAMNRGPVNGNDSVTYLAVAGNIAAGRGITSPFALELTGLSPREALDRQGAEPLTAWPPLYPLALAAGDPLGLDPEEAATGLNIGAAAATAALTAALARRRGLSWPGAGLVSAVVVVNPAAVLVFATAGSEALFVPLSLGSLLALTRAATKPDGARPGPDGGPAPGPALRRGTVAALVAFAGLAGAAALTRYAGLALVLTGAVVLARWGPGRRRRTRGAVAAATTLAATALPAWALVAARAQPGWRPGPDPALPDGSLLAAAVTGWVVPERNRLVALAIVVVAGAIAAAAALAWLTWRGAAAGPDGEPATEPGTAARTGTADGRAGRTAAVCFVYVIAYAGVVVAGAALVDHAIPLGTRLALPLLPVAAVLAGGWAADGVRRIRPPVAHAAAAAAVAGMALAVVGLQLAATGQDAATRDAVVSWRDRTRPPSMRAVAALPAGVAVFSNQPSSTYARSGRPALALPLRRSPATGAPNPRAASDEDELVELLRSGRAVVVIERLATFFAASGPPTMMGEADLAARVPLEVLAEDDEYVVLRAAPAGAAR